MREEPVAAGVPGPVGVVAHYNLLERLEPAGPGELYRARDTRLGRTVTVRILPADFVKDSAERADFVAKVKALATFSHPNVVAIFDAGEQGSRLYIVFEHVKGQSLHAEISGRMMNVRRAVELAVQITDAVADAHAAGFMHGGLSPESVLITAKGHAKIPVFELATRGGFDEGNGGMKLRDYDSPEEARGDAVDERSDIYSVGAMLYEMLTTRRPMHRGASAPSATNVKVPRDLDDVVLKALAPNPDSRWQSAATFASELRRLGATFDASGVGGDDVEPEQAPAGNVGRALVIAALILLGLGLVVWLAV